MDLPVIHVPMVIAGTGKFETPAAQVVERRVRLQDIANTVLHFAGLPEELGNGENLAKVWSGDAGPPPAHFAEATRSGLTKKLGKAPDDQWPNLLFERAVIHEDAMLVRTPWKETPSKLYAVNPQQSPMVDAEKTEQLEQSLRAWDATAPSEGAQEIDAATQEALRQLGYLE